MIQMLKIAYRNLGRNLRRSLFSALALGLGMALLLLMAAFLRGEINNSIDVTTRLQSGHIQIRVPTYEENKTSLKWEDLIPDPQTVSAQVAALPQVKDATPRLFATGIVVSSNQSVGVRVIGIDPQAEANEPYRSGLLSGQFLTADDRDGVLIGQPLAEKLKLQVGDRVSISINTSNGDVDEQRFVIRGIYSTQTNAFDNATIFLPLSKAQAFTRTENYASTIFILLKDNKQIKQVATALSNLPYRVLTWEDMNELIVQMESFSYAYMYLFYLIVLAITVTVVMNTLIMAVFERTREIGILAAIGWRAREISTLFLVEAAILALAGIIVGLILGILVTSYLATHGFYVGYIGISGGMLMGNTIYAELTFEDTFTLTTITLLVTLLAGLYPAILAAHLEPIQAIRDTK